MAIYWCETCAGKHLDASFKSYDRMMGHLKTVHGLKIFEQWGIVKSESCWSLTDLKIRVVLECKICAWYAYSKSWDDASKIAYQHQRTHQKYYCCGKGFRSLIVLLRHVDKVHGVHVGYERGMSHRRLFLDGITK